MQMARSTYYFELSKADQVAVRNHCLADEIKDIFSQHKGRYGVRRVYQELIKRGHKVNHKRVQRLMHTMGLAGKRPKEKYHSYKGEVGKVAENILDRDFSTTAPMQNGLPMYLSSVFVGEVLSLSYTRHEHKRNHFL